MPKPTDTMTPAELRAEVERLTVDVKAALALALFFVQHPKSWDPPDKVAQFTRLCERYDV